MLDRTNSPSFTLPDSVQFIEAESFLLSNSAPLHIINAGQQDVIRLELVYKAGSKEEELKGVSYFTSKLLTEGTSKYSGKEIIEYLDLYGAFYELHHGPDHVILTFYFLKKYVEEISKFIKEVILDATFPTEELDNYKNITLQGLKVNLKKTSYLASVSFKEHLFGVTHPYGKFLKEEDLDHIKRDNLSNFYNSYFKNRHFEIIVSGYVDSPTIGKLKSIFGSIDVVPITNDKISEHQIKNDIGLFVEKREDSLQSSIRVGSKSIRKNDPDYFYWVILNEIFGGYFGSRLMKNIREEKGFTYGISSSIAHLQDESYLVIGTDVKKDNTGQTLEEIEKEINILKNNLIPAVELETVKNYMIGTFLSSINTPFSLADKFKSIYFHKLDYSFYSNYLKKIRDADSKVLLEIANKYLDFDKMIKVVAGGI